MYGAVQKSYKETVANVFFFLINFLVDSLSQIGQYFM